MELSEQKLLAEELLRLQSQIPDEVHIIVMEGQLDKRTVFYKTLKKTADFYELSLLDELAATSWAQQYITQANQTADKRVLSTLIRFVGTDQFRLQNELDKFLAYGSEITAANIEKLVEKNPQDTVFQLLESALSGSSDKALRILDELERAHEDPFQIANMLVWQANIVAIVASAEQKPDAEVAKQAKLNPFVVKKTKNLVSKLTKAKIHNIINTIAECDIALKTSSTDPWRIMEQTVLAMA